MKNSKRNIAVIGVVSLLMCFGTSNLNAQRNMRLNKDCPKGIEYSDQQKEQIKKSKIEFAKATKDLKNQLNELRAQQNTLMSAEKPDLKAIYANIDKVSVLKSQLKKEQFSMKMNMKSVLTDEQKVLMANRPMRNKGMNQAGKGKMGNGQARMRGNGDCTNRGFTNGEGRGNGKGIGKGEGQGRGKGFAKGEGQGRQNNNWMNLSDEQKAKMQELRTAHIQESKSLRDEAEELQLKQKHMMTSQNIDEKSIMATIDRLSGIQNKLAKMKVDHKMEVRKLLTEDQLSLFLSRSGMGRGFGNGNKHRNFNN